MRRHLPPVLLLWAVAMASAAATPVPSPVHVQAGAAAADGTVSWQPAVQHVTGEPGETAAVDLALHDGTEHDVTADLSVRDVTIDREDGPRPGAPSTALTLAVDRVVLRPGDRGAFRAVAEIPSRPTVVAVEARLRGDGDATPLALVLLGPTDRHPALSADVAFAGGHGQVTVSNRSSFPALVDVAVSSTSWVGPSDDVQVADVLVPADGERVVDVELSRGLGRRSVSVAVGARGAPPEGTARAEVAIWTPRTGWVLLGAILIALVGAAAVRMLRRS